MKANRETLTKKQKGYLKMAISNVIFEGIFLLCYYIDISSGTPFAAMSLLFLLLSPIYGSVYGVVGYCQTKSLLYPNIMLFLFSCVIQVMGICFIVKHYVEGTLFFCFITSILIAFFSFISGVITKRIIKANRKSKERLLATQAQEIAELEEPAPEEPKEE